MTVYAVVGPVDVTRSNDNGQIVDQIDAVSTCNCGPLTATEVFPQTSWSRWKHFIYDTWGNLLSQRQYFKIPTRGEGEAGVNYLGAVFGYDRMGRQNRIVQPSGTIQRTVYDVRGLVISKWTGTDDRGAIENDPTGGGTPGNNMVLVTAQEYDDGQPAGDGNLTKTTLPVDANSANDRITLYGYDYLGRRTTTTATDGTTTWISITAYDNQNRPLQTTTYQNAVADANRISQSHTAYDLIGRAYLQETDGVDPYTGNITNALTGQNWFDLGNNIIKSSQAGSTWFTKTVFDALNRATVSYQACVPGTAGVPDGDTNDVSTDTVLEQNETVYDGGGNVIQTNRRQRFDDATGTGALQNVNTQPAARVTSHVTWPDAIGRPRVTADYGTNGGLALNRPGVAPVRSDTVLLTTNRYKDNGEANATIDPMGLETRWENDQMDRRIRLIENYVANCPDQSRISEYSWHPSGKLQRLTLLNSDTGDQITQWVFGTTLDDSEIASSNLLCAKTYPESQVQPAPMSAGIGAAYAQLTYTYNRQGQVATFIDADGTAHAYGYDQLGRLTDDAIPNLGPNMNGAVMRIGKTYETRGMPAKVTSYSAATGGTVVNQVAYTYDAFKNLLSDRQSHNGPVTSSTPTVNYTYADGSANTIRRTSVVYPNGRILNTQYGTANSTEDHFNRVTGLQLADESVPLVEYTYVGVAWQVIVSYPQPAVQLTYKLQDNEPVGDAGDPFNGYDRFGRSVDLRWQSTTAGNAQLERIQYGFDRNSRRTWYRHAVATGNDFAYSYDGLSQVTQSALGNLNLNSTAISAVPIQMESWNYDPTGNWQGYSVEADGALTENQLRVHDKGNRLMQISNDLKPVLVDQAGRMTQVAPDASGNWANSQQVTWDAWNRITGIAQGDTVIATYTYDGSTRRITKSVGSTTIHTYYSDLWRPLEERQNSGVSPAIQHHWGARHRDDLVRRDRAIINDGPFTESRYVLMDYFSPAAIIDGSGAVTERYRFSAFGIRTVLNPTWVPITTSECNLEFGFHGKFLDEESGFSNFGYRYLFANLGRWLSKDPIYEADDLNLYAFVKNRPVNGHDHFGLSICCPPVTNGLSVIASLPGVQYTNKCGSVAITNICIDGDLTQSLQAFNLGAYTALMSLPYHVPSTLESGQANFVGFLGAGFIMTFTAGTVASGPASRVCSCCSHYWWEQTINGDKDGKPTPGLITMDYTGGDYLAVFSTDCTDNFVTTLYCGGTGGEKQLLNQIIWSRRIQVDASVVPPSATVTLTIG